MHTPSEGLFGLPLGGEPVERQLSWWYREFVHAQGVAKVQWTAQTVAALAAAGAWLAQRPGAQRAGLAVTGPFGGGKTTLIKSVASLLLSSAKYFTQWDETDAFGERRTRPYSRRIVYQTARNLYSDPRFDPNSREWLYRSTFAECRDAGLCVLDDVGQEATAVKKWGNTYPLVTELILYRYEAGLPLVISSNLDIEGLARKYGGFVADRLYEMCAFARIEQRSFRVPFEEL